MLPVCLYSIDVEDWFHILDLASTPPIDRWEDLPSRVTANFRKLIDTFDEREVKTTCFFLGWVAEKYPELVKEAAASGHEIASHGYNHRLVYNMTPEEFRDDITRAKRILEDITGRPVNGFRSSGFSVTDKTPWFFDILAEAGYRYDSSLFPGPRSHGGLNTDKLAPHRISVNDSGIVEIPISVVRLPGRPLCFFGGGYLRFFPYTVVKYMINRVHSEGRPVVIYIHPREIDPGHPRLPMSARRRFKTYVNLKTTEKKLIRLIDSFDGMTFTEYIDENFPQEGGR